MRNSVRTARNQKLQKPEGRGRAHRRPLPVSLLQGPRPWPAVLGAGMPAGRGTALDIWNKCSRTVGLAQPLASSQLRTAPVVASATAFLASQGPELPVR